MSKHRKKTSNPRVPKPIGEPKPAGEDAVIHRARVDEAEAAGWTAHKPLVGLTLEDAAEGADVRVGIAGSIAFDYPGTDGACNNNIGVILTCATALGIKPPSDQFLFSGGQVFYRDGKLEEVRLAGVVTVTDYPLGDLTATPVDGGDPARAEDARFTGQLRWSTDPPPRLDFNPEDESFRLRADDEGRTHLSAVVVEGKHDPDKPDELRLVAVFLWDLRGNQPENLRGALQEGAPEQDAPTEEATEPRRRRDVMGLVPSPRQVLDSWAKAGFHRGLGKLFAGRKKIPDLDLRGEAAVKEADRLFWTALEEHLERSAKSSPAPVRWEKTASGAQTLLVVHGLPELDVRQLWREVEQALNATSGGPGVEVEPPDFEGGAFLQAGAVNYKTTIRLWPEERLRDGDGDFRPPVRFRKASSPGYVTLLDEHGNKPFFSGGWVWLPGMDPETREGFRIGGLPDLLYPEGRAALQRLQERSADNYEDEVRKLYLEPTLFQDEDHETRLRLQAAIRRARQEVSRLTTYDWLDVVDCVFEAFHRQRDAWAREELRLPDGRTVSTKHYGRFLRLDAEGLRLRLDPNEEWGRNWRARLFERLEALATFERRVETKDGRPVDAADRLLQRIIDGRREPRVQDGLWDRLRDHEAFSDNAFYVLPSPAILESLVVFAEGPDGLVHWGLDAVKAAAAVAGNEGLSAKEIATVRRDLENRARNQPYATASPRQLTVSNLDRWPTTRKLLARLLRHELTPNHEKDRQGKRRRKPNRLGGKEALATFDGRDYLACNGQHGHGYRVRTWRDKVGGYEVRRGRGGGAPAFGDFLDDLEALSDPKQLGVVPELVLSKSPLRTIRGADALAYLDAYRDHPSAVYDLMLRLYLPANVEDILRERLAEHGIDAVDEGEEPLTVLSPAEEGGPAPADFRVARQRAGWTQADLAAKLGVSREVVVAWERAKRPIPADRVVQLQEVLADYLQPPM